MFGAVGIGRDGSRLVSARSFFPPVRKKKLHIHDESNERTDKTDENTYAVHTDALCFLE